MSDHGKLNILLIDEGAAATDMIRDRLNHDCPGRYQIHMADHLKRGLAIILAEAIDVVLTRLSLPDSSESSTIHLLQEANPMLPVIVLSDKDNDELPMEIAQLGAQDYLVKDQGDGHLINRAIRYAMERKRIEQGLTYLSQYDKLTGLVNRDLFRERLNRAMIRSDRNQTLAALMFIDLDRFKNINDTLGHDAGDSLLIEVSKRLKECTRNGDTVARLGGDEFTIILEDLRQVNDAAMVAKKVTDALSAPIELHGQDIYITPSIGITIYPLDDTDDKNLLRNADAAMYRAKEQGRNCFQFYTAGMNTRTVQRLKLEAELRRALVNNEFILYFQPKVEVSSREIIGAEALIRWKSAELGLVSPMEFIPLAEETGLILPIGEWAIRAACRQVARWEKLGYRNLRMAVNLSARQFKETDVAKLILESAILSGIDPRKIEIEITESLLMDDTDTSIAIFKELKSHGLHISIDDFGTGYSSLSYLKRFQIDTLKIDKSFVRDINTNPDDAAIASAIIALAKSLRLNVVAEGVETEDQLQCLQQYGCHEAQGYLFSKPLPAEEFLELLARGNASLASMAQLA